MGNAGGGEPARPAPLPCKRRPALAAELLEESADLLPRQLRQDLAELTDRTPCDPRSADVLEEELFVRVVVETALARVGPPLPEVGALQVTSVLAKAPVR